MLWFCLALACLLFDLLEEKNVTCGITRLRNGPDIWAPDSFIDVIITVPILVD